MQRPFSGDWTHELARRLQFDHEAMTCINLNLAGEEELTEIDAVDSYLARAMIEARRAHAGFRDWDDVRNVPGMDELAFERLKRFGSLGLERDPDEQLEVPGDVSGEAAAQRVLSSRPSRGPS